MAAIFRMRPFRVDARPRRRAWKGMRLNLSVAALAPLFALLASCVGAPQRSAVPSPAPSPKPAPQQPQAAASAPREWQDRPATPGIWSYRVEGRGSAALFGSGAGTLLTVRCDTAGRQVGIARAGAGQGAMTVRTSYGSVSWPVTVHQGALPSTVAVRTPGDIALDQLAYSRGHFAVEVQGLASLTLPAWAEVARVIEDCRA